jgi:hypothetical protein
MRGLGLIATTLACTLSCSGGKHAAPQESPPAVPAPSSPAPVPPSAPQTPPKNPAKAQFAAKLWRTSLGKMYEYYLLAPYNHQDLPELAGRVVEKLLGDPDHTIARVAAVQMMNEDLYVKGRVNENVLARITLLEQEMAKGRRQVETSTAVSILGHIPFVFLAAIPLGSPLVRAEFSNLMKTQGLRIVAWVRRKQAPPAPMVQWRRLASRDFFKDYDVRRPFEAFMKAGIPIAAVEWINMKRKMEGSGEYLTPSEIEDTANF